MSKFQDWAIRSDRNLRISIAILWGGFALGVVVMMLVFVKFAMGGAA